MIASLECGYEQGLIKGEKFCFRYLDFYFQHGESTSTASQLIFQASPKNQDINKVLLLLKDLGYESKKVSKSPVTKDRI